MWRAEASAVDYPAPGAIFRRLPLPLELPDWTRIVQIGMQNIVGITIELIVMLVLRFHDNNMNNYPKGHIHNNNYIHGTRRFDRRRNVKAKRPKKSEL